MKIIKGDLKNKQGITLIALVITIIVLLILASISIAAISGDNSIINRAGKAKEDAERTELEEVLNKEYIKLETKSKYNSVANLDDAVEAVKNQGYDDKIVGVAGGGYKLNKEIVILSKTAPDNKDMLKIEEDTSASSGGTWYAVINGKYFKIEEDDINVKIAKEPSNVNPNSESSGDTINITSNDVTIANANIATFQVTAGDTVKVTASNEGSSTITINSNGKSYTANLTVVGTIEQAPANLDGALELLAETNNTDGKNQELKNVVMTTSDPDVATITTEGIVKCNKVADKEAIISAKQGETTRYFKVNSTATLATPTKMTSNKTINGKTTGTANNPIIPKDFYPVNTEKAKWAFDSTNNKVTDVDEGLVIMDEKGNQFVWVPVSSLNSMFMCKKHSSTSDCNIRLTTDGKGIECGSEAHKDTNGNYCTEIVGKLYATSTGEIFGTVNQTYTEDSGLREPDKLKGTSYGDWSTTDDRGLKLITRYVTEYKGKSISTTEEQNEIKDAWTKQLKDEFYNMALSVAKNGGFYVGRYESSLINEETRVVAGATSMSATTDSAGTWYGLYQKQKDFISTGHLSSTMIWGSQYDAIMNWIANGDNTKIKDNSGTNMNLDRAGRTGSKSTDKINNIFDLYGLRKEWTMEAYSTSSRVNRGGNYVNSNSPSSRSNNYPFDTYVYSSSRPTLYIQ